jgi:hypothetical protein
VGHERVTAALIGEARGYSQNALTGLLAKFPSLSMPRFALSSICAAAVFAASTLVARGTVVWSDDFSGQANGVFPTTDFNGSGGPDWVATSTASMFSVNTATGEPAPSLSFEDATSGGQGVLRLEMSQFAPFSTANPETPLLRFSFDWKIESFTSTTTNEAFRVILRANNSMAAGNQLVIGFNRADLDDGDALAADLTFYAGSPNNTSNMTAGVTSAIGLLPGVGWQPGFDFGQYGAQADNDSDDLFYRFDLTYDYTTGLVNGTATRLSLDGTNGQSAAFQRTLNAGLDFSNTGALGDNSLDLFLIASSNGIMGLSRFDNFVFESIPEPSAAVALLLGGMTAGLRRRPRRG